MADGRFPMRDREVLTMDEDRILSALLAACSVLGLDDDGAPIIPTAVVHDGLRFGLLSELAEEEWTLRAGAENAADTTIERTFPGGCMVTNIVAYREGEWRDPAAEVAPGELHPG